MHLVKKCICKTKYLQKVLLIIFSCFFSFTLQSQVKDSTILVKELNSLELSNSKNLNTYFQLLSKSDTLLSPISRHSYFEKGLKVAKSIEDDQLIPEFSYEIIKVLLYELKDLDRQIEFSELALEHIKNTDNSSDLSNIINWLGIGYAMKGDFTTALDHFLESYKVAEEEGNPEDYYSVGNIAKVLYELGDTKNALLYRHRSIAIFKQLPSPKKEISLNIDYGNLVNYYETIGNRDSVRYYFYKNIEVINKIDIATLDASYKYDFGRSYAQAVKFYVEENKIDSAKYYLQKVETLKHIIPNHYRFATLNYFIKVKNKVKSKEYFSQVDSIVRTDDKKYFLELKSEYYLLLNQYDKALDAQKELLDFEKDIANKNIIKYSTYVEAKNEASQKEKQIKLLEAENNLSYLRTRLLLLGIIFALSLLGFYFFANKKRKKENLLLLNDLENQRIIEQQSIELQKVDKLKNRLFANISHEIRTPLTLISGPIKRLLKQNYITKEDRSQLEIAAANSQQLLHLTEQIIDLTKNEIEASNIKVVHFNLFDLLSYTLPGFRLLAKNKDVSLQEPIYIDQEIVLYSDAEKLFTIIKNLISNAIKYTAAGGQVALNYIDQKEYIQIAVQDNGRGISKQDLPYIFDRYYQSETGSITPEGGTGIGLAICKEYVQLLNGEITVSSTVNKGSIFTIRIPKILDKNLDAQQIPVFHFSQPSKPAPVNKESTIQNAPLTQLSSDNKTHLLIVEDHLELRRYLKSILEDDHLLTLASNGKEALQYLETITPSLIITDLMMPVMDGFELVEHLKNNERTSSIPILTLTAKNTSEDQLRALRIGVDDYLLKPFDDDILKLHIDTLLDFSQNRNNITLDETVTGIKETTFTNKVLSKKDQLWLVKLEENISPLIGDFNLNIEQIAETMSLSSSHLNRRMKELTGLTSKRYIQEIRFRKARFLLENKKVDSVKAVAFSVGFKSQKHFSRNFKERFGKYPSEYLMLS